MNDDLEFCEFRYGLYVVHGEAPGLMNTQPRRYLGKRISDSIGVVCGEPPEADNSRPRCTVDWGWCFCAGEGDTVSRVC